MNENIFIACEKCEYAIEVNASAIKNVTFKSHDGKIVYITCLECPKCGNVHYVQIDDDYTKRLLEHCKVALKQAMQCKIKYKHAPSKKLKNKIEKARKKLSNARLELMKEYNETVFENIQSKEEVKIRFSL